MKDVETGAYKGIVTEVNKKTIDITLFETPNKTIDDTFPLTKELFPERFPSAGDKVLYHVSKHNNTYNGYFEIKGPFKARYSKNEKREIKKILDSLRK